MVRGGRQCLALLEIFLLLSAQPVAAHRIQGLEALSEKLQGTSEILEELQRAVQEERQQAAQSGNSSGLAAPPDCAAAEADFSAALSRLKQRQRPAAGAKGKTQKLLEAARLALDARALKRDLQKAGQAGCAWVSGAKSRESLTELLELPTADKPKCLRPAKRLLEGYAEAPEGRQRQAVREAVAVLLSPDCKAPATPPAKPAAAADWMEEELAASLRLQAQEGDPPAGSAALLEQGFLPDGAVTAMIWTVVLFADFAIRCVLWLWFFAMFVASCLLVKVMSFLINAIQWAAGSERSSSVNFEECVADGTQDHLPFVIQDAEPLELTTLGSAVCVSFALASAMAR